MEKVLFQRVVLVISNCMEKVFFPVDNMIVFMKWMVDQEREREEELKQWYLPYQ